MQEYKIRRTTNYTHSNLKSERMALISERIAVIAFKVYFKNSPCQIQKTDVIICII